jgi:predicted MFS family arabinose efflux permease
LLASIFFVIGYKLLPSLTAHMGQRRQGNVFEQIYAVAKQPSHRQAFMFISLLMMSSFTVIPYVALYVTKNVGLPESFLTVMYLCGGAATFVTSPLIGKLADRHGKLKVFRIVAAASFIPLLVTTHMGVTPWQLVLVNSTIFFILVPGRMIPGMAMVTAVPAQQVRGSFMTLVSTVQMASCGVASLVAGLIITQVEQNGPIAHYNLVGYIALACGLSAIWMARKLKVAPAQPASTDQGIKTKPV